MSESASRAVFLSYAREDAEASRRIADALRASDVEVWFDQNELRGGDAWDAKIKRQIRECALFMPVISAHTQARREGYFRLEWRLADQRTHLMGKNAAFVVPVCIDEIRDSEADVPDSFLQVQWTRFPDRAADQTLNDLDLSEFAGHVKRLLAGGDLKVTPAPFNMRPPPSAETPPPAARVELITPPVQRDWSQKAVIAALIIGCALTAYFVLRPDSKGPTTTVEPSTETKSGVSAAPAANEKTLAVLSFANQSEEKENEFFAEGISEDLINLLAKVPGLKVAGRTSAFYFKNNPAQLVDIARQLGVIYVVDGSVQRANGRAKIKAELVRASDGITLWANTFTRDLKDIFAVQDEIAGLIAQNLQLKLGGAARAPKTVDPEAHRLFIEGRHFTTLRWAGFAQAEKAFAEAVRIDPSFAPAHAGLAEVAMLHGLYVMADGHGPVDEEFARAKVSAHRAMGLDPSLAEPHATLGLLLFMERRWDEAERHFQETLRLNPNNGMAYHWHGLLLGVVGKLDGAITALARSVDLDPLGHTSYFSYGGYLLAAGRFQESVEALDRCLPIAPPGGTLPVYYSIRAVALASLGRNKEAIAAARIVRQMPRGPADTPHWWADGDAIYVLQRGGAKQEAEEYLRELEKNVGVNSHIYGYALCAMGRFDEGLTLLEKIEPMCQTRLYFMPMMESLQNTPRLRRLFAKLGSESEYKIARETLAKLRTVAATK